MSNNNLKQKIEVILFMSREPLSAEDIAGYTDTPLENVQQQLADLVIKYASAEFGIQILCFADKFQFATKPEFSTALDGYVNAPVEAALSTAAMETLAIIAYRQPITRAEVEAIRGVNSDGIMRSLLEKELIEEAGQADTIGRPILHNTTPMFLKHFGLKTLTDLPPEPNLKMAETDNLAESLKRFRATSAMAEGIEDLPAGDKIALTSVEDLRKKDEPVLEPDAVLAGENESN